MKISNELLDQFDLLGQWWLFGSKDSLDIDIIMKIVFIILLLLIKSNIIFSKNITQLKKLQTV
jgi:hypothetical protein